MMPVPTAPVAFPEASAPAAPVPTAVRLLDATGLAAAPVVKDAVAKRAALVRMKRIALAALVMAAVGFLAMHVYAPKNFWTGLIEAFFEASMVGAFADWFAVTALFRHPMGLPIPHTAIIPTRKARIAGALSNFVGQNFLTPQNVLPRLEKINFAEVVGTWLETPGNVRSLRERVVGAIDGAVEGLSDARIQEFSDREILPKIKDIALAPKLSELVIGLSKDGQHEEILDEVLRGAAGVAAGNRAAIEEVVRGQVPRFDLGLISSDYIVQRVTDAVMRRIDGTIADMLGDRANPLRLRVHEQVRGFLERLDTDPAMQEKVNGLRDRLLESPALQAFAVDRWQDFKGFLRRDLHDPESAVFGFLEARGVDLGRSMLDDRGLPGRRQRQGARRRRVGRHRARAAHPRPHPRHHRALGPGAGVRADRTRCREGPAVHPHQRHARGRPRGDAALRAHALSGLNASMAAPSSATASDASDGKTMETVVPMPSVLSTSNRPPKWAATSQQSVRPSPLPFSPFVPSVVVLWPQPSLISARRSGGMPTPVSATRSTAPSPKASAETVTRPPSGVNLTALATMLRSSSSTDDGSASTNTSAPGTASITTFLAAARPSAWATVRCTASVSAVRASGKSR